MPPQMISPVDAPLIAVEALELRAGPRPALSGVDLRVGAGKVHGLLGPKGAGKSTLLRVLADELRPTAGSVEVAQACVLVTGDDGASPIEAQLSVGSRMRIALARAIAAEPAVLLVDEPAGGFDAETAAATRALVQRHAIRGGACVWATRRLDSLHGLATEVTVLAGGRPRYSGGVEALMLRALAGSAEQWEQPLERAA
jgi:ABC-type multidrug transport system ATPase subunit